VAIVYLAEAHFVERDDQGRFVDGWPIGYEPHFEVPQHKQLAERLAMAEKCLHDRAANMPFFAQAHAVVCDSMDNSFHRHFGVWPEDVLVIDPVTRTLVMRGAREGMNYRGGGWCKGGCLAEQLEEFLEARGAAGRLGSGPVGPPGPGTVSA
jgi:hypothetical protein